MTQYLRVGGNLSKIAILAKKLLKAFAMSEV